MHGSTEDDPGTCAPVAPRPGRLAVPDVLAALVVALSIPVAAPEASAQEPAAPADSAGRTEVTAVEFEGGDAVDREHRLEAIVTQATSCASPLFVPACLLGDWDWAQEREWLDPAEVARDVERLALLYESWGYPEVRVSAAYDSAASETAVRFRIRPGPPLRVDSLAVEGLDRVDPPIVLPPRLPLQSGEPYALPRLAMIEAWLRDRMAERGHPFGQVDIGGSLGDDGRSADITLSLDPGPPAVFGPLRIEAGAPLDAETVRPLLRFEPGEPYDLQQLFRSERSVYRLPIVRRVVIQPAVERPPEAGATDTTVVPVTVRVVPRDARETQLESTLTSTECLTLAGYRHDRWFLGGPRLFAVGVGVSNLGAGSLAGGFPCTETGTGEYGAPQLFAEARLRQPWPGRPATQLEVGYDYARSSAPEVYVREHHGATLGLSHALRDGLTALLRYQPSWNTFDASGAYFCGSYGVCSAAGVDAARGPAWLAPVEAAVSWTPSGVPRQTVLPAQLEERLLWGPLAWQYWARAGVEAAGPWSGSDWSYQRALAELSATRPLGIEWEVAGHLRLGWVRADGSLPPMVRLYAGGLYSVRGYAENAMGPASLVTSAGSATELGCDPGCDPDQVIGPDRVSVRPTGGDRVAAASVEARYWLAPRLQLAAFVDVGTIHRDPLRLTEAGGATAFPGGWTTRITPGIGIRSISNLGPVRIDLAYDPSGVRTRPLFAADDGDLDFRGTVGFDPYAHDDPSILTELFRRLQLHVGIGQPF